MKVRILRGTVAAGVHQDIGNVVDVDKHTADYLVRLGKAERIEETRDARMVESAAVEPSENAAARPARKKAAE